MASSNTYGAADDRYDGLCQRCLAEGSEIEEVTLHRVWQCPCNPASCIFGATDKWCKKVEEQKEEYACFWLRGLVPNAWTEANLWPEYTPGIVGCTTWEPGIYFSDGSGGIHSNDPRLRRTGWGIVRLDQRCSVNLLTSMACPTRAKRGTNGDLWTRVFRAREQKPQCTLRVARVWKSHITAKELAIGCATVFDMRGNTFADEMASRAAKRVEVLPGQAGAVQAIDGMAWQVRMRIVEANLAAITDQPKREFLPQRSPCHRKRKQQRKADLLSAIAATGHVAKRKWRKRRYCHCEKSGRGGSISKWKLAPTSCSAILARHDAREPAPVAERCEDDDDLFVHGAALDEGGENVQGAQEADFSEYHVNTLVLGSGVVHYTHETWLIRGITFCGECGAWATTRECTKEPGKRAYELRRLITGKEPNSRMTWPADIPTQCACILEKKRRSQRA